MNIEHSLVESVSEDWYRSWCCPGSDGSWGGPASHRTGTEISADLVDPRAKGTCEALYNTPEMMDAYDTVACPVNLDYSPLHTLGPHSWSNFEREEDEKSRLKNVADSLAVRHAGDSVVVCSHGGPCTHMYEILTGGSFESAGMCGYAAISIYEYEVGEEGGGEGGVKWTKKVVNDSEHM